jgi:hypothetical protein
MRARTVSFERGIDPKASMKIGLGPKKALMELKKVLQDIVSSKLQIYQMDDFNDVGSYVVGNLNKQQKMAQGDPIPEDLLNRLQKELNVEEMGNPTGIYFSKDDVVLPVEEDIRTDFIIAFEEYEQAETFLDQWNSLK